MRPKTQPSHRVKCNQSGVCCEVRARRGHWPTKEALAIPECECRVKRSTVNMVQILPRIWREGLVHFHPSRKCRDTSTSGMAHASLWPSFPTASPLWQPRDDIHDRDTRVQQRYCLHRQV